MTFFVAKVLVANSPFDDRFGEDGDDLGEVLIVDCYRKADGTAEIILCANEPLDRGEICTKLLRLAQAIEARRAETAQTGSVGDESAVPQGCAQNSPQEDSPDVKA